LSVPSIPFANNTQFWVRGLADERFYSERSQRYSNDNVTMRAASALTESTAASSASAGTNVAQLTVGLSRRDYFFGSDSASSSSGLAKQERTEYTALLAD